jgi:hypothetical protein
VLVAESPANDALIRDALTTALHQDGQGLSLPYRRIVASVWWESDGPRL